MTDEKDINETTEETTSDAAEEAVDEETQGEEEFSFVEDPTFDIDYKGDCAYEVGVSIAVANEHKQAEEMFEELQQEAEIPGFRRGRAPRKLVERKFEKAVWGASA